jgi:hypothetical protein
MHFSKRIALRGINKGLVINDNRDNLRSRSASRSQRMTPTSLGDGCLRSPHKLKICGGPERSKRTAKQIVRTK